ncbi:hypothetical protein GDO86_011502, partial [Hymenochirus boettgeri]
MQKLNEFLKTKNVACKCIRDLLQSYEADPVDLLLDLGFGVDEPDICTKIPTRFIISPSGAKGINIRVFLEAQKQRMDIENPNLCGRFRQLEVLEQVTNAFSALFKDVNLASSVQDGGKEEMLTEKKSIISREKRKRICQLILNFAKQAMRCDDISGLHLDNVQSYEVEENQNKPLKEITGRKVFRKTRKRIQGNGRSDVSTKESTLEEDSKHAVLRRQKTLQSKTFRSSAHKPVKQCSISSDIPWMNRPWRGAFAKSLSVIDGQVRLQPPESFELEEVQSFEEDYPRTFIFDNITEMMRTNSCQSDSSGFQEESSDHFPLKNITNSLSLFSDDNQATLMEKKNFQENDNESEHIYHTSYTEEEYKNSHFVHRNDGAIQINKPKQKLPNSENGDGVLKSFASITDEFEKGLNQTEFPDEFKERAESDHEDPENHVQELEMLKENEDEQNNAASEMHFPVYIPHYLSEVLESNEDFRVLNVKQIRSNTDEFKNECQSNIFVGQLNDMCGVRSVELPEIKWTPTTDHLLNTPSINFSDWPKKYPGEEANNSYEGAKKNFQSELNTNIYKSVTIQMSSNLKRDLQNAHLSEYANRKPVLLATKVISEDVVELVNTKEACSQTEKDRLSEPCANTQSFCHKKSFLPRSHSFDTFQFENHYLSHPKIRTCWQCCHCCHHCCLSRYSLHSEKSMPLRSNLSHTSMEKELADTMKLIREYLTNFLLPTDNDRKNVKKACQKFREQLMEIEQCMNEQQARWLNMSSAEESLREEFKRLYLLRRNVLQELSELELHLDERAQHFTETISMLLQQVLEEQSKLYSDLGLSKSGKECTSLYPNNNPKHSYTSVATTDYKKNHKVNPDGIENENKSQKLDFNSFLHN